METCQEGEILEQKEVFENRREVAQKLLSSLREYGRLGAAGQFSTRPYFDGEKKYRFSMANYLRLAAMDHHYGDLHDPRWYTMEEISRNGWKLKEYAQPEQLEVWRKSPEGTKVCDMVDFYHVTDLPDRELLPDKEASLKECIHDLQAKNVLDVSDKISLLDGLHAVQDYARRQGASDLSAVVASQMWLTESGVRGNFDLWRGLYSEELLASIERNPDSLFSAAHQAREILNQLEHEPRRELSPVKDEPFAELEVCYYWCETDIKDMAGGIYLEDTLFTGKAAYEFLARYNALDKRSFNEKIVGGSGYHKSEIELRYKDYDHGEMRIDLGDLELGGKTSVTDALIHRLDMYRQNLLQDEETAKRHWAEIQREGDREGNYEDFLEKVKKESVVFRAKMEEFRQEETAYLAEHPELEAVNQEEANMFFYTVRSEDFEKLPYGLVTAKISEDIPQGYLLKDNNFAVHDFVSTYPEISMPSQNNKERIAQANFSPGKAVTFSSGWQPSDVAERIRRGKFPPLWLAVSPKEQELLHRLEGFHLEIAHEAPFGINGHKRALDYAGYSALRHLHEEVASEEREARTAVEQRFSLRGSQVELSLSYNDEPLFQATYESGKQELFAVMNEHGGIIPENLQEPIAAICKYLPYDSQPTEILKRKQPIWENFPTLEESRENYIKDCHAELDLKDAYHAANYYAIVTLLNPEVKSPEDFSRCMVEEMLKDGITQNRMVKLVEQSGLHSGIKEKIRQIAQSPETKSAIRKLRAQNTEVADHNDSR